MIFDSTFQIEPQALAIANILNTFPDVEGKNISTFVSYNGREKGICLFVDTNNISTNVLAIKFAENRSSDDIFVESEVIKRPMNGPVFGTFSEKAYNDRKYFANDKYYKVAEYIYKLIQNYKG